MKLLITALLITLFLTPPSAFSGSSVRSWSGDYASVGDSMYKVKKTFGEPTHTETVSTRTSTKRRYYADGTSRSVETTTEVVNWYICIDSYVVRFTFEGNTCIDIESLVESCN